MTGSLQEKHGKYYVVVRISETNGKIKQRWIPTNVPTKGNNKRKAQKVMGEILEELSKNETLDPYNVLFVDWIDSWLEQKKNEVRQDTYEGYELYARIHIKPYFNKLGVSLKSITPLQIQSYYNQKSKMLSANSLKKHHVVIHGALQEALRKNMILFDPSERVTLPKQKEKFIGKAYTAQQANTLLSTVKGTTIEPAVILGLFYGLRRSEVLGLRWCDVDFEKNTITIQNTVVKMVTLSEQEKTKSRASHRTMYIIPETKQYFLSLKEQQKHDKEVFGAEYHDGNHVCVWTDGKPLPPDYVTRTFKKLIKKNGLPVIRFHDLRHTAGSLLLDKGLSIKQIQEYLGHEKVSTTLDIYGHLSAEGKMEAANTLNGILDIVS
ncbi:MAG: site-specific integrase [Clostridiaceae bacterium]|nr:site-specific integrase [Clostridiaceae bacterium]